MTFIRTGSTSSDGYHDHKHFHNRALGVYDPSKAETSLSSHHNPLNELGWSSRQDFQHSHPHEHEDPARIGHDPGTPDVLNWDQPPHRYFMDRDFPNNLIHLRAPSKPDPDPDPDTSVFDDVYDFFFGE